MRETVIDIWRGWVSVSFLLASLAAGASAVAAPGVEKPEPSSETPFGAYLAGRHAQHMRDYQAAASWFEDALRADPESPELITRTFLMEASEGRFERARTLAKSELKLDSTDAVAELVLLMDRVQSGDTPGALARAEALPAEGVHRFVGPLARSWTRVAMGDLAGADAALQEFDKFNGFAPLKYYQRHGRDDEAQALYQRFVKDNAGSELAESAIISKPAEPPPALIGSAEDGFAEALFD